MWHPRHGLLGFATAFRNSEVSYHGSKNTDELRAWHLHRSRASSSASIVACLLAKGYSWLFNCWPGDDSLFVGLNAV